MRLLPFLFFFLVATAGATTPAEIRDAFSDEVARQVDVPEDVARDYLEKTMAQLQANGADLTREQFVVSVDRNPAVQTLFVFLGNLSHGYYFIGAGAVSTGSSGRFDHYITPPGIYDHTVTDYSDFRAEGTKNSNGIRGYGAKGMRIWDLGWTPAEKGWLKKKTEKGDIRFQLHATDPGVLEPRLGRPDSKGCVRVSAGLNTFLDKFGVLDWHYEQVNARGKRPWVWRKDRVETGYSGRYLVVLDSGVTSAPSWASAHTGR